MSSSLKKIGILGASGYTGHELIKILEKHGGVEIAVCNSETSAGKPVTSVYPDFRGSRTYTGYPLDAIRKMPLDGLFLASGDEFAKQHARSFPYPVIDLSHALRFDDDAVYGLPELSRAKIPGARLVANPGCYVTSCLLAAAPLVRAGVATRIVFDAKSGWSGAGRQSAYAQDPARMKDNLVPYKIVDHRHKSEIERHLGMKISFTPHVLDTFRGILTTAHVFVRQPLPKKQIVDIYAGAYGKEPFLRILTDRLPELRDAQNTNLCVLGGFETDDNGRLVVVSVIDNLVKGASGQAVQNMNLLLGFPETQGLLEPNVRDSSPSGRA